MATHSGILAWRISWIEEPGGLQSMGLQESDMTQQLNHHRLNTWVGGPGSSPTSFKLTICYRWVPVHPVYVRSFIHLFIQVFNICQAIVLVPREQERHGPCLQERKTDPS